MITFCKLGGCMCLVTGGVILANGSIMPGWGPPLALLGVVICLLFRTG